MSWKENFSQLMGERRKVRDGGARLSALSFIRLS